jgi:hypothetical protein
MNITMTAMPRPMWSLTLTLLLTAVLSGCFSAYHRALNEWALSDRELLAVRLDEADAALDDAVDAVAKAIKAAHKAPWGDDASPGVRQRVEAADLALYQVGKKTASARDVLQQRFSDGGTDSPIIADARSALELIDQTVHDLAFVLAMLNTSSPADQVQRLFDLLRRRAADQHKKHRQLIDALRDDT